MNNNRDALIEAMRNAPDDDAPRLVWADREGGERGEIVIVQCKLARHDLPREDRHRLIARERELLAQYGAAWSNLDAIDPKGARGELVRGFVENASVPLGAIAKEGAVDALFTHAPLVRDLELSVYPYPQYELVHGVPLDTVEDKWVELEDLFKRTFAQLSSAHTHRSAAPIRALTAQAAIYQIDDFPVSGGLISYADELVTLITDTDVFCSHLEALTIPYAAPTLNALQSMAASLATLKSLSATTSNLDAKASGALLLSDWKKLRGLALWNESSPLRGAELALFLARGGIEELTALDLGAVAAGDLGSIARTASLASLERLAFDVKFDDFATKDFEDLARSPYLKDLRELEIVGGRAVTDDAVIALANGSFAPSLRRLALTECTLTARVIEPLLTSFPALELLDVRKTILPEAVLHALLAVIPDVRR